MSVSKWIIENGLDKYVESITNVKIPAYIIIDSRCVNYSGEYDDLKVKINKLQVWYEK